MSLEAWIDVGGTFTDCLVRTASGEILRTKTLSSSRVPVSIGSAKEISGPAKTIEFLELQHDSDAFWVGADLCSYNARGEQLNTATIVNFARGCVELDRAVDFHLAKNFELVPNCEAPVLAVRRLLQIPLLKPLPPLTVRLGTTRGTNALLTRSGARVALLITSPFEELLEIGDQTRPDLFALNIVKPTQLSHATFGIDERLESDGNALRRINTEQATEQLRKAKALGCNSIAISLMHSYCNPQHELILADLAGEMGFEHVSVSHQLASVVELVARTQTTVVDAYLSPTIRQYFYRLSEQFGSEDNVKLLAMTSAGGLVDWREYAGKDCILSGPAGGVVTLSHIQRAWQQPIIGLDMGGTSTDVSRAGELMELQYESNKAGVRILTPTLPIETVAAGGGSICWFDGVSLRVGPQSAGAFPGPACYGRGGPLTITDLNVVSGRVPIQQFPFPVDTSASWQRVDELIQQLDQSIAMSNRDLAQSVSKSWTREKLVDGLRRLATQQMAEAVRTVSIKQGVDPRGHALVGFGGAAGQHICEIADELGITTIIDHPDAGLLSAVGMGLAQRRLDQVIPVYQPLQQVDFQSLFERSELVWEQLRIRMSDVRDQANDRSQSLCNSEIAWELRYTGTDSTLSISLSSINLQQADLPQADLQQTNLQRTNLQRTDLLREDLQTAFSRMHLQRFGYVRENRELELVALRVGLTSSEPRSLAVSLTSSSEAFSRPKIGAAVTSDTLNRWNTVDRAELIVGQRLNGPIVVLNAGSTLVIEAGWQFELSENGMLLVTRANAETAKHRRLFDKQAQDSSAHSVERSGFDPVLRDCYAQRLSAIATQMGYVLQQTAVSVNIKQRRDFSCAVFDGQGNLLANAPHVPVHLGAMGVTVRAIIERFNHMRPGDSFLCNDPYCGGSHLPDLTLVRPVFDDDQDGPSFFVANRAHHADVGGIAPGSMSIAATRLEQEGVVISPFQLTCGTQSRLEQLKRFVDSAAYPPRNWNENLADLNAQQAACVRGEQLLGEYARSFGWQSMKRYANHLLEAGHARIRQFIEHELTSRFGRSLGKRQVFSDQLEDGTPICVQISKTAVDRLRFDFSGTGPASSTNLNANPSIVTAAVLYVLRTLVSDELPLNEGVLRAVDLVIPESVLNPKSREPAGQSPAVAAGNVETSQRVVDVLLGAFQAAAASQGTMNNLLFGNKSFGFYETICGGAGATGIADGASAVHTHMTNTRLTDPEVLEQSYPVRLTAFHIRRGSGGKGRYSGGDGIVRTFEFRDAVTVSLITSRRKSGPFGLLGGDPGMAGENWLKLPDEEWIKLPASCQLEVPASGKLSIHTPGGGGFGLIQGD